LQIPLDGNCHTTLHAKADAAASFLKGNRKDPVGRYWDNEESEQRAQAYLMILVQSIMDPPVETEDKKILLGNPKVDLETRAELELLKIDLPGVTNLSQVVQYCINFTLDSKGYKDNEKANSNKSSSKGNSNRSSNVWGVRGSKRGKFDKG
jgi:hypothetical protein